MRWRNRLMTDPSGELPRMHLAVCWRMASARTPSSVLPGNEAYGPGI
jgi:hypothetical protein